jgi:acyl-CoA thioester hydrolase
MHELKTNYPVKVPIQTRFCDTDASGHINNVALMSYFELARANYFRAAMGRFNRSGQGFILGSIDARFLRQAYFGDELEAEAGLSGIGRSSFRLSCRLLNRQTGEVIAESNAIVVSYDFGKKSSVPLPDDWKKAVAALEGLDPEDLEKER